jgi:hypothetical protein
MPPPNAAPLPPPTSRPSGYKGDSDGGGYFTAGACVIM